MLQGAYDRGVITNQTAGGLRDATLTERADRVRTSAVELMLKVREIRSRIVPPAPENEASVPEPPPELAVEHVNATSSAIAAATGYCDEILRAL